MPERAPLFIPVVLMPAIPLLLMAWVLPCLLWVQRDNRDFLIRRMQRLKLQLLHRLRCCISCTLLAELLSVLPQLE